MSLTLKHLFIIWLIVGSTKPTEWVLSKNFEINSEDWSFVNENMSEYNFQQFWTNLTFNQFIFLEWLKILPDGYTRKINYAQVNSYKNKIDELLQENTQPIVILYSGNLPLKFAPLGGWTNPIMVQYFTNYARQVFKIFGDRVKKWITFYEPRRICESFDGLLGSEYPSGVAEYLCIHNILKAHADVYHIYDRGYKAVQNGQISISLHVERVNLISFDEHENVKIAEQNIQFEFGIFANPIISFDYPKIVISKIAKRSKIRGFATSRLPEFTYLEKSRIKGSCDYLEINYYQNIVQVSENTRKNHSHVIYIKPRGEINNTSDIRRRKITNNFTRTSISESENDYLELLNWIKNNYHSPKIVLKVFRRI